MKKQGRNVVAASIFDNISGLLKYILSDLRPPAPNGTFGLVALSFRLRNLLEIFTYPSDES
jgi:hypothetical protein